MTEARDDRDRDSSAAGVNAGYAAFQVAKALATSQKHEDAETRARAEKRVRTWETVLRNILTGTVEYGSRTPVEDVPAWATLEVVTGGFATGSLLAGGPLQDHERDLLRELATPLRGEDRTALNAHFLTDRGLTALREQLLSGRYTTSVPEEGALLVVAWLVENDLVDEARRLLDELSPLFSRLRFYPIPVDRPQRHGSQVHLQTAGDTLTDLRRIEPNRRILTQKEAVEVWAPLHDQVVSMFLETVEEGWPCRNHPDGWSDRALAIVGEYTVLRRDHVLCSKPERANGHQCQLRTLLGQCARKPKSLTGRDVGRIRMILNRYVEKRGVPGSSACHEARSRQASDVSAATFHAIAQVVITRLAKHRPEEGLAEVSHLHQAVTAAEAHVTDVQEGTKIPGSIRRKAERCLSAAAEILIERGVITSGDTLAHVLPQVTSWIRAAGISDPTLRRLYAAIYRAFRQRRSLLLLNLEKQVQMEDLPWVQAIDAHRTETQSNRELARQSLEEIVLLTLTSFPQAILPNKFLQEIRALAKGAQVGLPLVDELAADIFAGTFSGKFVIALAQAAELLDTSLYATYYGIDYPDALAATSKGTRKKEGWFRRRVTGEGDALARLCAERAGVGLGTWDPATNGMIIEQQQILTTQNLASVIVGLGLVEDLRGHLDEMAKTCFTWICKRQQIKIDEWHGRLIMVKNTAYAWRQMVLYLSLRRSQALAEFLEWATAHLDGQGEAFRTRFRPALRGLVLAAEGRTPGPDSIDACQFLGWSNGTHWLLTEPVP